MLKAAADLNEDAEFLIPLAPTLTPQQVEHVGTMLTQATTAGKKLRVTTVNDARATLFHARASVVASGTATVEAALIGNPFVVVYRVSALTYEVARRVVKVPFVAMVNLVAGREVVPELIQNEFTAANVAARLRPLLHDEQARSSMQADLRHVSSLLKTGRTENTQTAIDQVARISLQLISEFHHRQLHPGQVSALDAAPPELFQRPVPPRKAQ